MTDKPRVWVSRPTFPGIVARLEPHFEVTVEPEERKFSPSELAAGLDVFEGEPALHPGLLELDNVVLSPHIASASTETRRAMTALAVDNVLALFGHGPRAGRPPTILNPNVLA
ncbi:2-hydroxyacid dehydrogenase [Rhodanobacter denitrificans]|nr:2-hydroxyacid dehydrogenase [Rhodanobacter denitrificans]